MIYQDRKISETASFMILVNFCRTLLFDYSPNIADSVLVITDSIKGNYLGMSNELLPGFFSLDGIEK